MNTLQVQLKVSLSEQLRGLLESKAARLGIPITQFVKHIDNPVPTASDASSTPTRLT